MGLANSSGAPFGLPAHAAAPARAGKPTPARALTAAACRARPVGRRLLRLLLRAGRGRALAGRAARGGGAAGGGSGGRAGRRLPRQLGRLCCQHAVDVGLQLPARLGVQGVDVQLVLVVVVLRGGRAGLRLLRQGEEVGPGVARQGSRPAERLPAPRPVAAAVLPALAHASPQHPHAHPAARTSTGAEGPSAMICSTCTRRSPARLPMLWLSLRFSSKLISRPGPGGSAWPCASTCGGFGRVRRCGRCGC